MSEKKAKEARREAKEAAIPALTITIFVERVGNGFAVKTVNGFPGNLILATQIMGQALATVTSRFALAHQQGQLDENLNIKQSNIIIPHMVSPGKPN